MDAKNIKIKDNFLEHQYSPSQWAIRSLENGQDVVTNFFEIASKATEEATRENPCDLDVEYSDGKNTKLDIYYPGNTKSNEHDVLIFIHGGYWTEGSKESYAILAKQVKALECVLVFPGYDLAPYESMDGIVGQIKSAVQFTAKRFPDSRLFLCGHSAGAHLCAMMFNIEWDPGCDILERNRLTGFCLMSGVYNLIPLLSTYINEPLKMNKEIAARNSPITIIASEGLKLHHCRVLVVIGEHDSPEFHRQSKEFLELLKQKLKSVVYLEIPSVDHFELIEKFLEKDYCLTKEIYNFMKK